MYEPLVSVVMPAYNAEEYVGIAIESILEQSYNNWELLIVNDASTDRTLDVIHKYKDERITLLSNECNQGISFSTNKAIDYCRGKYIALMDDDDISLPNRISVQVDYLEQHADIDVIGGRSEHIDKNGAHISYGVSPRNNPKYIKSILLFQCLNFHNGTTMFRKKFVDKHKIRYRDGYIGMQDYQFFIEASKVGNISSVDKLIFQKRFHGNNETNLLLDSQGEQRAKIYSMMRKESLKASGFTLLPRQFAILDYLLKERDAHFSSYKEMRNLIDVFKDIHMQGKYLEIDYLNELELVMRKICSELLAKSNIFDELF